jgi:TRAP-type C4-dicarboxylate transport system permease small subunit
MGLMQQVGARLTLIVVNAICLLFSCILIFYGATGVCISVRVRQ